MQQVNEFLKYVDKCGLPIQFPGPGLGLWFSCLSMPSAKITKCTQTHKA